MSYIVRTNLKCTNPELISRGSEFCINSKSEIMGSADGEMHFISRNGGMENDIEELSKKYPDEIFLPQICGLMIIMDMIFKPIK